MSPEILQYLIIAIALVAGCVFVLSFKFALREATSPEHTQKDAHGLPCARLHGVRLRSANRWHRGACKQRFVRHAYIAQAGLVAFGITSVFIMLVCMAGICLALIASSV